MFSSFFFVLNLQTASAKPSLLAALNKSSKQVSRTGSDVSTQSSKCELCSVMNTLFQGYMETLLTVRKSVGNGENIHLLFFLYHFSQVYVFKFCEVLDQIYTYLLFYSTLSICVILYLYFILALFLGIFQVQFFFFI